MLATNTAVDSIPFTRHVIPHRVSQLLPDFPISLDDCWTSVVHLLWMYGILAEILNIYLNVAMTNNYYLFTFEENVDIIQKLFISK